MKLLVISVFTLILLGACAKKEEVKPPAPPTWYNTGHCGWSHSLACWSCIYIYQDKEYVLRCER